MFVLVAIALKYCSTERQTFNGLYYDFLIMTKDMMKTYPLTEGYHRGCRKCPLLPFIIPYQTYTLGLLIFLTKWKTSLAALTVPCSETDWEEVGNTTSSHTVPQSLSGTGSWFTLFPTTHREIPLEWHRLIASQHLQEHHGHTEKWVTHTER